MIRNINFAKKTLPVCLILTGVALLSGCNSGVTSPMMSNSNTQISFESRQQPATMNKGHSTTLPTETLKNSDVLQDAKYRTLSVTYNSLDKLYNYAIGTSNGIYVSNGNTTSWRAVANTSETKVNKIIYCHSENDADNGVHIAVGDKGSVWIEQNSNQWIKSTYAPFNVVHDRYLDVACTPVQGSTTDYSVMVIGNSTPDLDGKIKQIAIRFTLHHSQGATSIIAPIAEPRISGYIGTTNEEFLAVAAAPGGKFVILSTDKTNQNYGFFYSTDSGVSWRSLNIYASIGNSSQFNTITYNAIDHEFILGGNVFFGVVNADDFSSKIIPMGSPNYDDVTQGINSSACSIVLKICYFTGYELKFQSQNYYTYQRVGGYFSKGKSVSGQTMPAAQIVAADNSDSFFMLQANQILKLGLGDSSWTPIAQLRF